MFELYFHDLNEQHKEITYPVVAETIEEAIKEAENLERENNWECWGCQRLVY